jgi:protein SCO1
MKTGFAVLLGAVLSAGVAALAYGTEGFRVVTSEGARELAVERTPRPVPDVALIDQDGRAFSLHDYRGGAVLVDFIYTRCPTICTVDGDDLQRVQTRLQARAAGENINLLSISFDPHNDDRDALKLYGDRFGAQAPRWRIAAPADGGGVATLLKTFDVTVIPDGRGGFVHNGAVYAVDARGRLVHVLDPDATEQIVVAAEQAAQP